MHFFSKENNFMGGWGIIGEQVPIAAGFAFAAKYRKEKHVSLCFMGDGAVSIGPFHEGLCLAALWRLPVVFVVENNGYAMGTPVQRQMLATDASVRALGYPMARATVDGCDVVECFNVANHAIERARSESLPMLIECKTYRFRGHSMADPAKYRTKQEVSEWKKRDPLLLAAGRIERDFPELASELDRTRKSVEEEVADAVSFADSSPVPDPRELGRYTYFEG